MAAEIIDGKQLSKEICNGLKADVAAVSQRIGRAPKLAVVLVGENPASQVYVRSKSKKARSIGMEPLDVTLPASIDDQTLQSELQRLSSDASVDGILLQLPLPDGLDEFAALMSIDPAKDVDGLHPMNQGLLARGNDCFVPCTPAGCIKLVERGLEQLGRGTDLTGLHAAVVGRSILVGKPVGQLLLQRNCTLTMCHSRTKNLAEECRRADILVAAVGRPELVRGEWIQPGSVVIDVGINRLDDGSLVGDVAFSEAQEVAGAITPVPGGVGPMTIAMLLANTVQAAGADLPR